MTNAYLNQSWRLADGGYVLVTIVSPTPLPSDAVRALEPVVRALEVWAALTDVLEYEAARES